MGWWDVRHRMRKVAKLVLGALALDSSVVIWGRELRDGGP